MLDDLIDKMVDWWNAHGREVTLVAIGATVALIIVELANWYWSI